MACVTLSTLSSMTSVMGTVFQYLRLKEGMEQLSHTTLCPLQAARCASWSGSYYGHVPLISCLFWGLWVETIFDLRVRVRRMKHRMDAT